MASVAICTTTYRRPLMLGRMLASLARVSFRDTVRIFLVDNDVDAWSASSVAARHAAAFGDRLVYLQSPVRGLASPRNVAIDAALAAIPDIDFVLLLDDDSVVLHDWIAPLVDMADSVDADCVGGPVFRILPPGTPRWIASGNFFPVRREPSGAGDLELGGSNTLLRVRFVRRLLATPPLHRVFDPVFDLSGGEDVDLTLRARNMGVVSAWEQTALVLEDLPESRVTREWLVRRHFLSAQRTTAIRKRHAGGRSIVAPSLFRALRHFAFAAMLAVTGFGERRRMRARCNVATARGYISGLLGRLDAGYAETEGN